ncbi:hypothetical protein ACMT4L_16780 [Deinococcus sp. A31D244]|uniref:hypothetical protein n=1 Tax=Deinococcus sp. A31D244 TaxID=3397675 RepID=UPI0039E0AF5A
MERTAAALDSQEDGRMAYSIRESIQNLRSLEEVYARPSITLEEFLEAVKDAPPSDPDDDAEDIAPPALELEAHWKAGFLRGAKFWYGRTEAGTMWQSEQNECWQAAGRLWPAVRPERLEDARQIALAQAQEAQP